MAKNLVIVESPAKAKTIEKFLGKDFQVESSYGHIADLPSKELGIDVDGDFRPKYIISDDKKPVVKKLKSLAKKADMVWLASDEDREGEAIANGLIMALKLKKGTYNRVVFNEITKKAIMKGIDKGWVRVNFDLKSDGTVSNVRIIDSSPRDVFDMAARRAILKWKYRPKIVEGKGVIRKGLKVQLNFGMEN